MKNTAFDQGRFSIVPVSILAMALVFCPAQAMAAPVVMEKAGQVREKPRATHARQEKNPGESGRAKKKHHRNYTPSERITADQAVAFPVDI